MVNASAGNACFHNLLAASAFEVNDFEANGFEANGLEADGFCACNVFTPYFPFVVCDSFISSEQVTLTQ